MHRRPLSLAAGLLAAGLAAAGLAAAGTQAAAQDFSGRTIELIVPAGAGGGLSRQAQRFAQTFADHIPGGPVVKIRNMPGGGGQKGINFVFSRARKDGTQMLWGPMNFPGLLLGLKGVKYDPAEFNPVGVYGLAFLTVVRSDLAGGLKGREDIVRARDFVAGARIPGGALGLFSRMSFDMLGIPYRFAVGYKTQPKLKAALMQNEIQAISTGDIGYWVFYKKDLLKDGRAIDLYYHSPFDDGSDTPRDMGESYGDVPTFASFYRKVTGKAPSGPKWETYKWFAGLQVWAMWMMLPPGTPADIVAAMRRAYEASWADQRTVANFMKASRSRPIWLPGDKAEGLLSNYRNLGPEAQAYLRSIIR